MPWAKLDDAILDNQKIIEVGALGFALHVAAVTWCARNLTDGFVPGNKAWSMLDFRDVAIEYGFCHQNYESDVEATLGLGFHVVTQLVEAGLWDKVEGGYQLHDYLDYNPSKAKVLAERERQRKKAAGSRTAGITSGSTTGTTEEVPTESLDNSDLPVPVPIPVPTGVNPPLVPPEERREAATAAMDADEVARYLLQSGYEGDLPNAMKLTGSGWSARSICRAIDMAKQYGPKRPLTYIQHGPRGTPSLLSRAKVEIENEDHAETKPARQTHGSAMALADAL